MKRPLNKDEQEMIERLEAGQWSPYQRPRLSQGEKQLIAQQLKSQLRRQDMYKRAENRRVGIIAGGALFAAFFAMLFVVMSAVMRPEVHTADSLQTTQVATDISESTPVEGMPVSVENGDMAETTSIPPTLTPRFGVNLMSHMQGTVVNTSGLGLSVRSTPSASGELVAVLNEGVSVLIADDVVDNAGFRWRLIQLPNGEVGWVVEEFLLVRDIQTPKAPAEASATSVTPDDPSLQVTAAPESANGPVYVGPGVALDGESVGVVDMNCDGVSEQVIALQPPATDGGDENGYRYRGVVIQPVDGVDNKAIGDGSYIVSVIFEYSQHTHILEPESTAVVLLPIGGCRHWIAVSNESAPTSAESGVLEIYNWQRGNSYSVVFKGDEWLYDWSQDEAGDLTMVTRQLVTSTADGCEWREKTYVSSGLGFEGVREETVLASCDG